MIKEANESFVTFYIDNPIDNKTVKSYLIENYQISKRILTSLKQTGNVQLNGSSVFLDHPVQSGDEITLIWPYEHVEYIQPEPMLLDICFEDDHLVIINKPAGIPVHPTMGYRQGTLANGVMYHWREKHLFRKFRPVNRLDRNTSGLILVAKNQWIHQQLSLAQQQNRLKRKYLTVVEGKWKGDESSGLIQLPIGRKEDSIIERQVSQNGKRAVTYWRLLERGSCLSLLELELETGRTHQIRVHLSHIGHPLAGDDLYGGSCTYINRQALHAYYIQFFHPVIQQPIEFKTVMPKDMYQLWNRFHSI